MEIQHNETSELADKQQQLTMFYDSLDEDTANYLKAKEYEIDKLSNKYLSQLGRIFKEAQERLASYDKTTGVFGKWIDAKGISRDSVYRWINIHNYLVANCDNIVAIETFENLPKSLSYEIAKPSAPAKLVQDVMDGKITNHRDYMIEKAKIRAEAEAEAKAKYEAELAEKDKLLQQEKHHQQMLNQRINNINYNLIEEQKVKDKYLTELAEKDKQIRKLKNEVKTEIIYEESPELQKALWEAQQKANELNEKLRNTTKKLSELQYIEEKEIDKKRLEDEIEELKEEKNKYTKNLQSLGKVYDFITRTKAFIKDEMLHIPTLTLPPNNNSVEFLNDIALICDTLENFSYAIKNQFINKNRKIA